MRRFTALYCVLRAPEGDGAGAGGTGTGGTPPVPPNNTPPPDPKGAGGNGGDNKPPPVETISMPKDAFDERLSKAGDSAVRKLLKEMGFDKSDDIKTRLDALKKLEDAQKSEKERLEGRIKELEPKATRADTLSKRFEAMVTAEFEKLPDAAKAAIEKIAGDDPDKRWDQIEAFRAAGFLGATPPPPAPPKNNAPPGGPPPTGGGEKTKFEEWKALAEKNPVMGSIFFRTNRAAIEASRPADS